MIFLIFFYLNKNDWYSFQPGVTAVARKRSRSFCQKCRWHVIAKCTRTLHMWLYYEWLYGVHKTCAETAPVSHRTCCVPTKSSAVSTPLGWIFKTYYKKKKKKTTLLFHLTQGESQGFRWGALTKNTEIGASTSILSSSFFFQCCLMSSDVGWYIRDKLRPIPKHGSI